MKKSFLVALVLLSIFFLTVKNYSQPVRNKTTVYVLLQGDFADPTIIRDGDDYYLIHTSYAYLPGLLIWHSKDLLNWTPITNALKTNVGEVWAPDLSKYKGKYYLYFPTDRGKNFIVTADKPEGPWSDPIELKVNGIDPGHIATPEGQRYLYVEKGRYAKLSDDGLKITSEIKKVYDGWQYPTDWAVECFCLESPKLFYHNNYYYLVCAQGGTAGPATSHMAVVARSKSPEGPWENSPNNPLIHTYKTDEEFVSKGHATLFEDKNGKWWAVYHAYRKGFLPMGRHTLLEPIEWTNDGWPVSLIDRSKKTNYKIVNNNKVITDDFSSNQLKTQWKFSEIDTLTNYSIENGKLILNATTEKYRALLCQSSNANFEATMKFETTGNVEVGLTAFYNSKIFTGIGYKNSNVIVYAKGNHAWYDIPLKDIQFLKIRVDNNAISMAYSADGEKWINHPNGFDVSGFHNNILGGFSFLKSGVIFKGEGKIAIDEFIFKPLN